MQVNISINNYCVVIVIFVVVVNCVVLLLICHSKYCLCVNVLCTTAVGCQRNCS